MSQNTLYFNGKIYTMDADNTCVSAMLVTGSKVAATGSDADLLAAKPNDAELVDLKGQVVLPGLVDGHAHVSITGRCLFELQLSGKSKAEVLELVRRKAEELPAGQWICGAGWNQDEWEDKAYPTKEELDAVAPDHPVRLVRYCGNAYWCNSLAINLAMSASDHSDENSGTEFMVNEKGELAGTLVGPFCRKIDDVIPEYTEEQYGEMYHYMESICLSQGTTTIMEKGAGAQSPLTVTGGKKIEGLLQKFYGEGKLKLRIHQALIGLDTFAEEYFTHPWEPFSHDDHLSVRSVKFWTDGAFGAHSAYLSEDYYDQPGHRGNRKFTNEELTELFRKYDALGAQIEAHTIGDETTTQVLDCYEAAFGDSLDADRRFIIDHVHVPKPEDIIRMGRLHLINSTQFIQFAQDMGFLPVVLSPEMVKRVYPWRAVLDAGCHMVNGADMDPVNPFLMLYVAIARKNEQGINTLEEEPLQKLTRLEAIRTCTTEAAYAMFMEDRLGSLEPGKYADFILIDRDYFTCPEEEIRDISVDATYIGGELVYARD